MTAIETLTLMLERDGHWHGPSRRRRRVLWTQKPQNGRLQAAWYWCESESSFKVEAGQPRSRAKITLASISKE